MVRSTPRPHFTPGKDLVPILQEAGWAPGPVWTGGKSRPHRDSIPDRPGRTQSLYRLSYPAHNGLGRLVEFRFKAPPDTTSHSITTHTSSGQRNCASWESQPQKSVTLLPCPAGRTTKSTKDMWWHWRKKKLIKKSDKFSLYVHPT